MASCNTPYSAEELDAAIAQRLVHFVRLSKPQKKKVKDHPFYNAIRANWLETRKKDEAYNRQKAANLTKRQARKIEKLAPAFSPRSSSSVAEMEKEAEPVVTLVDWDSAQLSSLAGYLLEQKQQVDEHSSLRNQDKRWRGVQTHIASVFAANYDHFSEPPSSLPHLKVSSPTGLHFGSCYLNNRSDVKRIAISNNHSSKSLHLSQIFTVPQVKEFTVNVDFEIDLQDDDANADLAIKSLESLNIEVSVYPDDQSRLGLILTWLVIVFRDDNINEPPSKMYSEAAKSASGTATPKSEPQRISHNQFVIVRPLVAIVDPISNFLQPGTVWDIFAKPFVPQTIKDVNLVPMTTLPGISPPGPRFNKYIQSWVHPMLGVEPNTISHVPPIIPETHMADIPPLTAATYPWHFITLLGSEAAQRRDQMKAFDLYAVKVMGSPDLWKIVVPGIVEDLPRVRIGDVIKMRSVYGVMGCEFEACVYNVVRRTAEVFFKLPQLPNSDNQYFNVQFVHNDLAMRRSTQALLGLEQWILSGFGSRILFPEPEDAAFRLGTEVRGTGGFSLHFFDDNLNWSQQKSVQAVVDQKYGDVPFLIWGPPGTGKTKTCIECIHQIIVTDRKARILACAPSHSAADTLTRRLLKFMNPSTLFRFNPSTRPFNEVPDAIMPFTFSESGDGVSNYFGIPPMETLLKLRVVVSTCEDAGILAQCGLTNFFMSSVWDGYWKQMRQQFGFFCQNVDDEASKGLFWTHLFIDEAGQATEPESLIPISVVACDPLVTKSGVKLVRVILSGDHMQLGPIIHSEKARANGLNVSLFERLIRRPLYRDHPESRCAPRVLAEIGVNNNAAGVVDVEPNRSGSLLLNDLVPPFVNLVRNYRSYPGFLMIPSLLYYGNTLIPAAPTSLTHAFLGNSFLPNPDFPAVFYGIQGMDERCLHAEGLNESESTTFGWFNSAEAAKVLDTVQSICNLDGVTMRDFGVISPFREQVKLLRALLRANGLGSVDVGTVEDYQGMERRIIVISIVRSRVKFVNADLAHDVGLVRSPARMNVAMTRAQALLVVVGNPHVLAIDPQWVSFLAFYERNGCYRGCSLPKAVIDASTVGDVVPNNYGSMERARDIVKAVETTPSSKWLGGGVRDDVGVMMHGTGFGDEEFELAWTQQWIERLNL
ncbi:P-loop containing nucleoside triphosphate hydrolase protein [Chytriomyces sp. MP71]|nr:P-loop containing nucleoside triphosphate hydrolase protein [Chytriomyces sp. MP71]